VALRLRVDKTKLLGPGPNGVSALYEPYAFDDLGFWCLLYLDPWGFESLIEGASTTARTVLDDGSWAPLFEPIHEPPARYARRGAERPWSSNAA
jgi:hypothetical protein